MTNKHTRLDLTSIQENTNFTKRKLLSELGSAYDLQDALKPLRWNIKPRYTGIKTHFSYLREQIQKETL